MRQMILRAAALCALVAAATAAARAQTQPAAARPEPPAQTATASSAAPQQDKPAGGLFALEDVRRELREQREEIERLRAAVREQSRLIGELRARVEDGRAASAVALRAGGAADVRNAAYAPDAPGANSASAANAANAAAGAHAQDAAGKGAALETRVARAEEQAKKAGEAVAKQIGNMTFGGDLRLRYESFYGQQNAAANPENPGTLGNPLTTRQRLRLRARFAVRGRVGEEFDWGLRLATGNFADVIGTNQTLTDFFTRKTFALDQAYFSYRPRQLPGFQVQAGKFDTPWTRTELTWDNDISVEGLSESYTRTFKNSAFKNLTLVAWQLPMLERNSAFVLGADGRVDFEASGRAGRDLALYGAQARTEVASKNVSLRLSAADLYFSGTQFITPAQVFSANIQFPVSVVIPASGTTPARTVTTQVSVPRDLLVAGNANLGLSLANTNAVNFDGRLASGFNLVDLIARADFAYSRKWPVMVLFNFVTNTRTRDVLVGNFNGENAVARNDQGQGYWAEFQIGKDLLRLPADQVARGDAFFNYTLIRAEKDAILSPFNGSDLGISTDMRVHRFFAGYALDPKVAFTFTGFLTQRPTGLLGVFGQTPPGSLNRATTRLQFDTVLRF